MFALFQASSSRHLVLVSSYTTTIRSREKHGKIMLTGPTRFCQQDGVCDKASAPSVSSISRLLRGPANQTRPGEDPRRGNHSIDGILGEF